MPGQTVYQFRASTVRSTASATSVFVRGSVVSICDSPAFSKSEEDPETEIEAKGDGLDCARGLRWAFILEAGMVVLGYGIWHLWHMAH